MKTNFTLEDLLELENDTVLINHVCPRTGIPIWPLLRIQVLRTIISSTLYKRTPLVNNKVKQNIISKFRRLIISSLHNVWKSQSKQFDIMFFSTGLGNYYNNNNKLDDRLIGEFSRFFKCNSIVYQNKLKESIFEEHTFGPVIYRLPFELDCNLRSKLADKSKCKTLAKNFIRHVDLLATIKLDYKFSDLELAYLENYLLIQLVRLPIYHKKYLKFFARSSVKLLFIEDASYGGELVAVLAAAKQNSVKVVEYQHGAISKGHDAYNVSTLVASNENYKSVLPDVLLTYGSWWSKQCNLPIPKISIGNPYREIKLNKKKNKSHEKRSILILGDGYETSLYLELSQRVFDLVSCKKIDVLFRPHPLERANVLNEVLPAGVTLDLSADIYESFSKSLLVISEVSTGLFEAVGIAENILMWETEKANFAYPESPFDTFKTYDDLKQSITRIFDAPNSKSNLDLSECWAENWEGNLFEFLETHVTNKISKS